MMLESLESKDMQEQHSFMSVMMRLEESNLDEDSVSYYDAACQIADFKYR